MRKNILFSFAFSKISSWILSSGFWNDGGSWVDTENWND